MDWVNPRAYFFVNVKDSSGTVTNWAVEFGNPLDLEKDGWKPSVLHIGDVVTVDATPARGSSQTGACKVRGVGSHGHEIVCRSESARVQTRGRARPAMA